jgi:hypothetical protein
MKKTLGFIVLIALCLTNSAYAKQKSGKTLVGTITGFECGDNCYLTIVDKKGTEHRALCFADVCDKFAEANDANLAGYKGKTVKVTIGKGNQVDGANNIMGVMDAFTTLQVIK